MNITDHRGQEVARIGYFIPALNGRSAALRRVCVRHGLAYATFLSVIAIISMACLIAGIVAFTFIPRPSGREPWWEIPLMLIVGLPSLSLYFYLDYKLGARHHQRFLDSILQLPCCASCGYDLDGLRPEPDNCTLCPECGAAWRLPQHAHQSTEPRP